MLPWAHPSPMTKTASQSVQPYCCTAHDRQSLYFIMGRPPQNKIAPFRRDLDPRLIMVPWAHPSPRPKRHLNRFCRFRNANGRASLYFIMGCPFFPVIAASHVDIWTPSNAWFLEPTRAESPKLLSRFIRAQAQEYDRQTDRPRCSVCNNRPHSTVMRPKSGSRDPEHPFQGYARRWKMYK